MSFKTKNKKKLRCDTRVTLDAKHSEKVKYFNEKTDSLALKTQKINDLNIDLNNIKKKKVLTSEDINTKLDITDEIRELELELDNIKSKKEDISYLLDTGHLLFQYYNNINDTANGKKNTYNVVKNNNSKSVMEYFNTSNNDIDEKIEDEKIEEIKPYKNKNESKSRANILDLYMSKIDEDFILKNDKEINVDICTECNVEKILYLSEGFVVCPKCGEQNFILIDSDKPSYKDPPREVSYFAYKRINHFNEWLAQFQAKESTDIPQDVYDQIIMELKKERLDNMADLTPQKLREILKKLKKNKYYEHVPHIINRLNGIPPPIMSREKEEELRRMFKEIQIPFHKFCPKARKNFLSYSYVLHKFVQLLELDEFLPCFMLLKSREKLHQQDLIWKQICEYLNWEFIPSL